MGLPMAVLALACLGFGLWPQWPLSNLIKPALWDSLKSNLFAVEFHYQLGILFWLTIVVLTIAILNHIHGVQATGRGQGALEHVHHAPVLGPIYQLAEGRYFDPYVQGRKLGYYAAKGLYLD